jgi:hypothetical protein
VLFALATFMSSWDVTSGNVGLVLDWPKQLMDHLLGATTDTSTLLGAFKHTATNALTFLFLYLVSALLLRERKKEQDEHRASAP